MKTAAQIADEVLSKVAADAPKKPAIFKPPSKGSFGVPNFTDKSKESGSSRFELPLRKATKDDINATR